MLIPNQNQEDDEIHDAIGIGDERPDMQEPGAVQGQQPCLQVVGRTGVIEDHNQLEPGLTEVR